MSKFIQPVVLAIVTKDGKYLLTKRQEEDPENHPTTHDKWEIAGGGLEFGELPEETLHREVKEELGTEVNIIALLPQFFSNIRGSWNGLFIVYICELKNPANLITLNHESSEFKWCTLEEIKQLDALPKTYEMYKAADDYLRT